MLELVLNFFFPPVCGICGKLNSNWLCDKCAEELYLKKNSKILKLELGYFDEFIYFFEYKDIRNIILNYKFRNKPYLGRMFSSFILKDEKICCKMKLYDIIIPVPMSSIKKSKRGYNQTEIISKILSKFLEIDYKNNVLIKKQNNKTQSGLVEKERFENIKNIFKVKNAEYIKNKNVIIFDDILTTGATANECARILKENGAKKILVLTIAKD